AHQESAGVGVSESAGRLGRVPGMLGEPQGEVDPRTRRRRKPLRHYLESYAFLALLIIAAIFFSTWAQTSETFPSAANIRTLIASNSVIAIVALAALVPLVCYEFDLSVG